MHNLTIKIGRVCLKHHPVYCNILYRYLVLLLIVGKNIKNNKLYRYNKYYI